MQRDKMEILVRLAEARKTGALARLEILMAQVRACEAEIIDAEQTFARDFAEQQETPMAQLARRSAWVDQRIALARRRIAALAPAIAAARSAAIQGLGKHKALETLAERAERTERQALAARVERETPPPDSEGEKPGQD